MYSKPYYLAVTPASVNYGENVYGEANYGVSASTGTTVGQNTGGFLPNTGQDILLPLGLGLLIIGASLALMLRRKKKADTSSTK